MDKSKDTKTIQVICVSRTNAHHSSDRIYVYKGLTCYMLTAVNLCWCDRQGSHFSATTKFQDFSRNLTPFSRYIFALAANLQLQF